MSWRAWAVSTISYILAIAIYLGFERSPGRVHLPGMPSSQAIAPAQKQEISLQCLDPDYLKWLRLGQRAEEAGNLSEAMRCYTWAFSYRQDVQLEEHIQKLEQHLRTQNNFGLLKEASWVKAEKLQKEGIYEPALSLYRELAEKYPSSTLLQTKIEFCRQVISLEHQQEKMLQEGDKLLAQGKWEQAIVSFREIWNVYEEWPDSKKESLNLSKGLQKARETLAVLEKDWAVIEGYLKENRLIHALIYARQISDLPCVGLVQELEQSLQKEMAWIPAGPFVMGNNFSDKDEAPQRIVTLPGYYIDRCEVTNRQYLVFVKSTGYRVPDSWNRASVPKSRENHPVTGVSWADAAEYARWAGKRLPTEAEWEKAARGTEGYTYPWGDALGPGYCNSLESGKKAAAPVGSFPKGRSPFGCFDMAGNVAEWTADMYEPYPGGGEPLPVRPNYRVTRGGAWYHPAQVLRCSNRYPHYQDIRLISIGFRCAYSETKGAEVAPSAQNH